MDPYKCFLPICASFDLKINCLNREEANHIYFSRIALWLPSTRSLFLVDSNDISQIICYGTNHNPISILIREHKKCTTHAKHTYHKEKDVGVVSPIIAKTNQK